MTNIKSQDPISQEDLFEYFQFVIGKDHEAANDPKKYKKLRRLARRTTTLSDATVLFKALNQENDFLISQLMEAIQVQGLILEKLGCTDDMLAEAKHEYAEAVHKREEAIKQAKEGLEAAAKEGEE